MTIDDVLTYYGHNQANVARALNICTMTICRWCQKKYIPYERQCQIEVTTRGELKASRKHAKPPKKCDPVNK